MNSVPNNEDMPKVTIVIPMLNEMDAIERCINSILKQDYPQEKIEINVVDGLSKDGSRNKVIALAEKNPNIRLIDNPIKKTPHALNLGIQNASGDIVIILGAHTTIKHDFVRLNIKYMNELNVKCVGGTQLNVGESYMQKAIGDAMASPFGIPSAPYRFHKKKKFVDTVVYAAYKKEIFSEIGYFDEDLHISEDAELNWRIRQAGYKIFFTPEIVSYYYPRKNIKRLIKQFFNYGILRCNVIKKHKDALKLIHLIPPLFVSLSVCIAILAIFNTFFTKLFLSLVLFYVVYIVIASFITSADNKKLRYLYLIPVIFLSMQLSWGLGFLVGIFKS